MTNEGEPTGKPGDAVPPEGREGSPLAHFKRCGPFCRHVKFCDACSNVLGLCPEHTAEQSVTWADGRATAAPITPTRHDLDAIEARLKAATPGEWRSSDGTVVCSVLSEAHKSGVIACIVDPADAALIAHAPTDLAALVAYVRELEGRITEAATLQICHLCHRRPYRFSASVDPCECLGGKCRCDGCAAYRELAHGDALSTLPSASAWQCGLCDQIASNAPEAVRLPKHSPRCTQRTNGGE